MRRLLTILYRLGLTVIWSVAGILLFFVYEISSGNNKAGEEREILGFRMPDGEPALFAVGILVSALILQIIWKWLLAESSVDD